MTGDNVVKKSIILTALFIIATLLLGCAQQAYTPVEPKPRPEPEPEQEMEQEAPEPEVEPAPEPEEKPEPKDEGLSYNFEALPEEEQRKIKQARNLLDEARDREENYFFRYSGPGVTQSDVWVKGDLMKRSIMRPTEVDKFNPYNMVYLNRATLKAEGWCETTKVTCYEGKGPFPESFAENNNIKTPKDWILELDNDFRWALDNKIGDQLYHIIDYNFPDKTIRLYVNDFRGWPARVEVYDGKSKIDSVITKGADVTYIYDDMDIGGVSDDDVIAG